MFRLICIFVYTLTIVLHATGQKNEGDPCIDEYTNTVGRCAPATECQSANDDYLLNGIRPTFCAHSSFGSSLVCCKDGTTILQAATRTTPDPRPVWGNNQRVSERNYFQSPEFQPFSLNLIMLVECVEYSRGVVEKVDYIPLLPDPETLSISAAKCDYTGVELIVGGEDATQGEFPHMAAIGWPNFQGGYSFLCGGSLISPRFVLSAGHCLSTHESSLQNPEPVVVRLGDQNIDPAVPDGANPIDVPIKTAHRHPEYKPPRTYNDIALFELNTDVRFNEGVRPACLWTRASFGDHTKAVATGWGVTETDPRSQKTSKELQKVSLSLLTNEYCDPLLADIQNRRWQGFAPTQMCAGELRGGKDTCQGDSGSPLQVTSKDNQCIFYIMGVTSFGRRCAESGKPAVYTRVSAYLDWIEQTVWPGE